MKEYYLDRWLVPFRETGNPIYAWRAFFNARKLGLPIPEDVLQYLDNVAHEITKVANDPPGAKTRPIALAKALGMHKDTRGQGSTFTDYSKTKKRKIALDTHKAITEDWGEDKKDYAFDEIAKSYKIGKSTIRNIYLEFSKKWEAQANEWLESGRVGKPEADGTRKFDLPFTGSAEDLGEVLIIMSIIQTRFKELP